MIRSENLERSSLAELLGVTPEYLVIMTSFLKCHDFCRPSGGAGCKVEKKRRQKQLKRDLIPV